MLQARVEKAQKCSFWSLRGIVKELTDVPKASLLTLLKFTSLGTEEKNLG